MTTNTNNERLARVEEKLDNACENVKNLDKNINQGFVKIEKRFDDLDGKYSDKWVEQVVKSMLAVIFLGVLGAILSLILK